VVAVDGQSDLTAGPFVPLLHMEVLGLYYRLAVDLVMAGQSGKYC